ncbi:MAG: radical SAM protein [Candidatus Poribacteria bacterium]
MLKVFLYPDGKTKYLLLDTGEALVLNSEERLQDCPDVSLRGRIEEKLPDAEFMEIKESLPLYPDLAHVHLTRECNLRCEHCYVEGGKNGTMSFSEARYIVDALSEVGVDTIAFGGGEVSLVTYFSQLVEYTTRRGITPTYTTNGLLLDIETAKRCGAVSVSVDGVGDDYSINRGCKEDVWNQIEANIEALAGVHPNVIANILVTRQNYRKLFHIVTRLNQLGIKQFLFLRFKPEGRGRLKDKSLHQKEVRSVVGQLLTLSLWKNVRVLVDSCSMSYFRVANLPKEALRRISFQQDDGCGAGRSFLCIDFDLSVKPCSFQSGPFPSLREHSFSECWETVVAFSAKQRDFTSNKCINCGLYYLCGGGCPVLKEQGEVDPLCQTKEGER